jgi:pyruvate dehydrogenase E2 component (dihydrolipoamide acetyltransferase)
MSTDATAPAAATTGPKGAVETIEPTRAQRTVARRMAESKATIPDFQAAVEVDVTDLLAARAAAGATVTAAIVHAAGIALREHPRLNGAYADGKFQHYSRANVGVVVGGAEALVVPTIFDADAKPAAQVSAELIALATEVRDGSITAAAFSGGTFTVSNLGTHGVTALTAIIQPGQSATLAVGAATDRLALDAAGTPVVRQILTLTLSADHRIVSGTDAAAFLTHVAALLADPATLLA